MASIESKSGGMITNPAIVSAAKSSKGNVPGQAASQKQSSKTSAKNSSKGASKAKKISKDTKNHRTNANLSSSSRESSYPLDEDQRPKESKAFNEQDDDLRDLEVKLKTAVIGSDQQENSDSLWSSVEKPTSAETPTRAKKAKPKKVKAKASPEASIAQKHNDNTKSSDKKKKKTQAKFEDDGQEKNLKNILFPGLSTPRKETQHVKTARENFVSGALASSPSNSSFAGSSFHHSPAPSSLPKPTGFKTTSPKTAFGTLSSSTGSASSPADSTKLTDSSSSPAQQFLQQLGQPQHPSIGSQFGLPIGSTSQPMPVPPGFADFPPPQFAQHAALPLPYANFGQAYPPPGYPVYPGFTGYPGYPPQTFAGYPPTFSPPVAQNEMEREVKKLLGKNV